MRQPERSASSTRRTPSTPTKPPSVGRPPRKATRNSLSQRLSRLVRSAGSPTERALRADLPGAAITVERNKFLAWEANYGSPSVKVNPEGRNWPVWKLLLRGLTGEWQRCPNKGRTGGPHHRAALTP